MLINLELFESFLHAGLALSLEFCRHDTLVNPHDNSIIRSVIIPTAQTSKPRLGEVKQLAPSQMASKWWIWDPTLTGCPWIITAFQG